MRENSQPNEFRKEFEVKLNRPLSDKEVRFVDWMARRQQEEAMKRRKADGNEACGCKERGAAAFGNSALHL
ncbi:MAG TPA: hypothetical protein VFK44_04645 [Bacillales bacterium]|nr:hypothetical protein [Bacillales bacterium]